MNDMNNVSCETIVERKVETVENVSCETKKQKTLANCTLYEFLRQANKIRKAVGDYYTECNFGEIIKRKPEFPVGADEATMQKIAKDFRMKQISDCLDVCLETNVEKTVEVIGLMCFMNKEEAEKMPANVFMGLALELISSQEVLDFFSKMVQSGMIDTEKS